jgi:hypothetical protein
MFRVSPHPSSGVLKIVTAISGIGPNIGTVFSTPDDGCGDTRNMYSDFAVKEIRLHTVASSWILFNIEL